MPSFPFFGFPNFYRRNYNYYGGYNPNIYGTHKYSDNINTYNNKNINSQDSAFSYNVSTSNNYLVDNMNKQNYNKEQNSNTSNSYDTDRNFNKKNPDNSCLFELFGLKLYFDDILLICLIFFLYNEGVKDEGLFIALILLLIS